MIRPSALLLTPILLAAPACAQEFNAEAPNAAHQEPVFQNQTRAPVIAGEVPLRTSVFVDGLNHPWGMEVLPDGSWLVTERSGNLRLVSPEGQLSGPISGVPEVDAQGQGGLLDVLIAPDFAQSRRLWLSFAAPSETEPGKSQTAAATATLSQDGTALENVEVIFRQQPAWESTGHYGSRLVLDGEGMLFITTGDRLDPVAREIAQEDDNHLGKLVRVSPSGEPAGAGIEGWLPETWAKGFRNVQSAALDGEGRLWTIEHGPEGGDELNQPQMGKNYGWPVITYGQEYGGTPLGTGITAQEGLEQPVYYWDPVIAPSGMLFYDGEMFPEWQGDILAGAMIGDLVELEIEDGRVTGEARHLEDIGRVRDVAVAPDGSVMLLTDYDSGQMLHVTRGN